MLHILLVVVAVLGCVGWLVGTVFALRTRAAVKPLADQPLPDDLTTLPSLSVLVPARNEVDTLPAAAETLLEQELPGLELVLVDDRSDDGTGAAVDALAARDERVTPIHVTELPEGWLGKNHALARAAEAARGDWLLFTDADVHFAPGSLARAVAAAEARGLDHVVVLPQLPPEGFFLEAALGAFGKSFTVSQRMWAVEDPDSSAAVGVGAFNLVRRSALERTPGFDWLRLDVADDLALGRMLKDAGSRCGVYTGRGQVSVRWYTTLRGMVHGLEKNTFAVAGCRATPLVFGALASLALDAAPLLALHGLGLPWLRWLGAATLLLSVPVMISLARWSARPVLPALLYPVGSVLFAYILLRSAWLGLQRGGIVWRGTFHPSAELRAGSRVGMISGVRPGGSPPAAP